MATQKTSAATQPRRTTPAETAVRLGVTLLGTVIMALGIALAQHSLTGNTPISTIPSVLFEAGKAGAVTPISLGTLTFAVNAIFIFFELALLGGRFPVWQLLQIPMIMALSVSVDFWMSSLIPLIQNDAALVRYLLLALSMFFVALGIYLTLVGDTILMPPDGFMSLLSQRTGRAFGTVKVAFDVLFLLVGIGISWALMGALIGIREGTVISAIGVGLLITLCERLFAGLKRRMPQGATPITPLPRISK